MNSSSVLWQIVARFCTKLTRIQIYLKNVSLLSPISNEQLRALPSTLVPTGGGCPVASNRTGSLRWRFRSSFGPATRDWLSRRDELEFSNYYS